MPEDGFRTISIRAKVYNAIVAKAEKDRRSIANEVEVIMEEAGILERRLPA